MFWCVAYALEFVDDTQQCCQATFDLFKKRQQKCSADELVNDGEVRFPSPVARNSECAIVYFIAFQEKFARVQNDHDQTHQTAIHPPKTISKTSVRFGCDVCGVVCVLEWFEAPLIYL